MTVDETRNPFREQDLAHRSARIKVYEFPTGKEVEVDTQPAANEADTVLQELEEALHNWF
jgi:hypothetical protein